jgi:hypothetical protein
MVGRGPAIHVFLVCVGQKTWVAGPRAAMTVGATHGSSSTSVGIGPWLNRSTLHSPDAIPRLLVFAQQRDHESMAVLNCDILLSRTSLRSQELL